MDASKDGYLVRPSYCSIQRRTVVPKFPSNYRATFTFILEEIRQEISRKDTTMRKSIPAERRLALTLYNLASTAEYRTIAHLFGVSTSFVCICIKDVCEAINQRLSRVIKFPQGEELVQVINNYEKKWGMPMCAGAIDGTHIPILAPEESHLTYVNRKGYHSIIVQAVVDSNYIFRDVVIGWPGSVHDARVLSNSSIYQKGNNQGRTQRGGSRGSCPPKEN